MREESDMDHLDKRVVASLLLLLGLTLLAVGLETGQLSYLLDLLSKVFEAGTAGTPSL